MISYTDIEARVAFGARTLDLACPGWALTIDTDQLDMDSCADCVLGQLFEWYATGLHIVRGCFSGSRPWSAASRGFTAVNSLDPTEFYALEQAWKAEIRKRMTSTSPEARP